MTEPRVRTPSSDPSVARDEGVSLLWLLAVLVRERRMILGFTLAGISLGLTIAFLRPKTYTTTFSFLPQSATDPTRAGLAGLAGQFGISLGALSEAQSPQLYADLLVTRAVLSPIATDSFPVGPDSTTKVPLATFLHVGDDAAPVVVEKTLRVLRKRVVGTTVATRTTGMVTVQVRTKSPYVSLKIAERLLEGLNYFNLITRQSQAREERRFTEGRLEAARASLRGAEDALQRFLQNNRLFAESPALTFQRDRLQREVLLQQQVVISLAQQYEENRIREVRDTPVITLIERPILAARPDPRLQALILSLGTVAGLCVGVLIVILRESLRDRAIQRDPALALLSSEWKRIRGGDAS
jgi:uncharacterized protein involved in exopolysaccharide biosynthesis